MDDNQPGQLMGSTPEPSNSYEVDDICRIRSMQKEGENVVLNIAKGGEAFLSVRIPGPMQGWWTGNYRVKLTIEPYRDPIADQLNAEAVCRMAIEHGVMRLKETGSDAFEAYNVGELPEPGGIRQNAPTFTFDGLSVASDISVLYFCEKTCPMKSFSSLPIVLHSEVRSVSLFGILALI
jgi:hypothetical protein